MGGAESALLRPVPVERTVMLAAISLELAINTFSFANIQRYVSHSKLKSLQIRSFKIEQLARKVDEHRQIIDERDVP